MFGLSAALARVASYAAVQRAPAEKRAAMAALRTRWERVRRQHLPGASALRNTATEMQTQRVAIAAEVGEVRACGRCAQGCPLPQGQWNGGFCCGGNTDELFSDQEILSLQLAGTRFSDLRPPDSPQAGCLFRGPTGCNISPTHRPSQCLTYVCRDLSKEFASRHDVDALRKSHDQLAQKLTTYREATSHVFDEAP